MLSQVFAAYIGKQALLFTRKEYMHDNSTMNTAFSKAEKIIYDVQASLHKHRKQAFSQ